MAFHDLVLHADLADAAIFKMVLRNASNYLNALPDESFDLAIVANGGAARLLKNDQAELRDLALPVLARGARLLVCANALAEHGLAQADIWPECRIVPAGLVEIVRLQRQGHAYIKP